MYAVEVDIDDGTPHRKGELAVLPILVFGPHLKKDVICETHLFDSDGDFYGQRLPRLFPAP